MTPGQYIKLRREAAHMTIADVMAVLADGGLLSAPLDEMERDLVAPSGMDAALLAWAYGIDDMILARMKDNEPVQLCTACGCSEGFECEHEHFGRCSLLPSGVCSNCGFSRRLEVRAA